MPEVLGGGITGRLVDDGSGRGRNIIYFDAPPADDEHVAEARRRGWVEARARDFTARSDGYYADRLTGTLYRRAAGDPVLGNGTVDVWYIDGEALVCLQRVGDPGTVGELEQRIARREAEQANAEAAQERDRQRFLASQPTREITLGDVLQRSLPTIRRAAEIIEGFRGEIQARDGRIVVTVPALLTAPGGWDAPALQAEADAAAADAAAVLVAAKQIVLAELAGKAKTPLSSRLPDRQVGADGGVIA